MSRKLLSGCFAIISFFLLQTCRTTSEVSISAAATAVVDKDATLKTKALRFNLKRISEKYTLFGQQDYASNGQGWINVYNRCDVKDVCGSNPALNSFDFLHFTNPKTKETKDVGYLTQLVHQTYERGGIVSFCWHYYNPVTGGLFYDTTEVVKHILPGGSHHQVFTKSLKIIADFANTARDKNGDLIPIIFRPWHEFDGTWFWWGKSHCSAEDFKNLYRFTVIYLRDSLHVHNFLYAFSPDCRFTTEEEYLERYPGNEYVDLVGMDNYWDFNPKGGGIEAVIRKMRIISDYALKNNKIAALTETGLANLPDSSWYTRKLLFALKSPGIKLAYAAVWRGEYVPYPGHPACLDFVKFRRDSLMIFEDDLPNMYVINKKLKMKKK